MTESGKVAPYFTKNVVQSRSRTQQEAAWTLLYTISELFPAVQAELRLIGDKLNAEYDTDLPTRNKSNEAALARFRLNLETWTTKNRLSSPIVNEAAWEYAVGGSPPATFHRDWRFDSVGNLTDRTRSIEAYPYEETREEFLNRAGDFYDQVAVRYAAESGDKRGPIMRELLHFKFLAAHLVGGFTWAELAHGESPFRLPVLSQSSISGGARKIAELLGIPLSSKRGARKGARRHRRQR